MVVSLCLLSLLVVRVTATKNAWLIKRQLQNNWTYCDFRRNVATTYLQKYGKPPTRNSACGVPVQLRVPNEVRSAGSADDHSEIDCSQRRCGYCHQRTREMCAKCNIGLHLKCWYMFHNKHQIQLFAPFYIFINNNNILLNK